MSVKLGLAASSIALLAACGLYVMKDRVSASRASCAAAGRAGGRARARLYRLRAEWAMLDQPARLARLAAEHLDLAAGRSPARS